MKNRNLFLKWALCFLLLCCLFCSSCQKKKSNKLVIATAANMQFAIQDLTEAFSQQTGIECETIISSSGKLTAQITEGAPFDIFVSADMKYPETLHRNGFTAAPPQIYAYGQLVLWTMLDSLRPSIELLYNKSTKFIALANPQTAPYGLAAMEVLQHYRILAAVEDKLVYGESIAQTNQFIISGAATMGFTAKSVVLSPEMKGKGEYMEIKSDLYSPIAQGIVLLKNDEESLFRAQQFFDFLFSSNGQSILKQYGYLISEMPD